MEKYNIQEIAEEELEQVDGGMINEVITSGIAPSPADGIPDEEPSLIGTNKNMIA